MTLTIRHGETFVTAEARMITEVDTFYDFKLWFNIFAIWYCVPIYYFYLLQKGIFPIYNAIMLPKYYITYFRPNDILNFMESNRCWSDKLLLYIDILPE